MIRPIWVAQCPHLSWRPSTAKVTSTMKVLAILALFWASVLAQVDEGRLPPHAIPTNYAVDSIIVLDPDFNFEGTFAIDIDVTQDSAFDGTIYFHADRLSIDEGTVTLVDQSSGDPYTVRIANSIYELKTKFMFI